MTRGRPRKTEKEDALHGIMCAFWQNGFKATSMNDLVEASGMAKPSLYAAFGDKEAMFEKSLLHYFDCYGDLVFGPLMRAEKHYLVDVRNLIQTVGYLAADKSTPLGCFLFNAQVENAYGTEKHKVLLSDLAQTRYGGIRTRLLKAVDAGELSDDVDIDALATYVDGQLGAVSILARTGGGKGQIDQFVETALKALPSETPFDFDDLPEFTLRQ
ncbi:TetR/AcrR family transcriptional regulator [Roseibium sp.]|uniref:TetR/AcrR family transcriptional regulator n=1 Tax=Roseibium sp. TaxID=1936156 RepID=UPI003B51E71C